MQYNPLSQIDRIEKSNLLTNKIIVKALKSNRGDIIRAMNVADLQKMVKSVFNGVHNMLAEEAQRAYEYNRDNYVIERDGGIIDPTEGFKLLTDVEIDEEISAFFEIDGKLQYRELIAWPCIALPWIDEPNERLMLLMKIGASGMQYDPFSVSDRLEKADSLTNSAIMNALQTALGDDIRAMSYAEYKQLLKAVFTDYYHSLAAEAEGEFEQACKAYDAERDGIENDPCKKFKPSTEFEIYQELKAYFEEQVALH